MEKAITREKELENVCKEQAARIEELNQLVRGAVSFMNYICSVNLHY